MNKPSAFFISSLTISMRAFKNAQMSNKKKIETIWLKVE